MSDEPANETGTPSGGGAPSDDDKALQELRTLLLSEEQHEIVALRERLESPEQRARDISAVVAEAIQLRRAHGGGEELSAALTPTVEEAVRESVRKDSHVLVEALFPVMGPAIRRSVAEVFRSTVESFNQVLESTFSIKGLQWRMEAIRTGRPYAEVALLRSLVYRVEQVFLIHQKTSLVLQHIVAPAVVSQDSDMVSSMLSAIRDFMRDSFSAPQGDSLDSLKMGELQIWIEQGPHAVLAAVIRGQAPQELRLTLKEKLEEVHRRFANELEQFEGNPAPFEAYRSDLTACLTASYREEKAAKSRSYVYICLAVLAGLLAIWIAFSELQDRKWAHFVGDLRRQPGIVITSFEKENGRYHIQGLRDPLAVDPSTLLAQSKLSSKQAEFQWNSFYALDDALILKRANALLQPPAGAALALQGGVLRVAGVSSAEWAKSVRERAPLIPGITAVDDKGLIEENAPDRVKAAVESSIIFFDLAKAEIDPREQANLASAFRAIQTFLQIPQAQGGHVIVEVTGHADSTGPEATNLLLSEERAKSAMRALVRLGIPAKFLRATGAGLSMPLRPETDEQNRRYNRSVTFKIVDSEISRGAEDRP